MEHTLFQGAIIEGEFDTDSGDFTITKLKNVCTQTVIDKKEIDAICHVLENNKDGQLVTINDQVFVHLDSTDVAKAIQEFSNIKAQISEKEN